MFKFMLIFHHPEDIVAFENQYQELLSLVERMPEITRRQVIHITGSPAGRSPYYRILEVYYVDQDAMNRSLLSPAGQDAGNSIQKFAADAFEMAFAEVYEENGGATPGTQSTNTPSDSTPSGDTTSDLTSTIS